MTQSFKAHRSVKYKQVLKTKGDNFSVVQYEQVTNWSNWQKGISSLNFLADFIQSLRDQENFL